MGDRKRAGKERKDLASDELTLLGRHICRIRIPACFHAAYMNRLENKHLSYLSYSSFARDSQSGDVADI